MAGISPIRLIAWGLLALGVLLFLSLLARPIQSLWRRFQPLNVWVRYAEEASPYPRRRRRGWRRLGVLLLLLLGLLLIASGWGLMYLEAASRAYLPFPHDELVARVHCLPAGEGSPFPTLCSLNLVGPSPYTATVSGLQWTVEGEVLRWDPSLEELGLRSGYRLLRLIGYDGEGRAIEETVLPAAPDGLGDFFLWLDARLPFFQLSRQVLSSDSVESGDFYELVVSPAGFSLKKWESQP
ncbi:MAG: hypothetical protein ACP5OO_09555 [Chloroflexia bacterium]